MIEGRGTVVIRRPAADIIAFVTDLNTYKRADWKIGRVYEQRREVEAGGDDVFVMRHGGTLRGLPGPPVRLRMRVAADGSGAHYRSDGGVARWFLTFDGGFDFEPVIDDVDGAAATRVTHVERFRFHWPCRVVAEPFLRAWIQRDVEAEVVRMKALLEAAPNAPSA